MTLFKSATNIRRVLVVALALVTCLSVLFVATLSAQEATNDDSQVTLEEAKAMNAAPASSTNAQIEQSSLAPDELFAGIDDSGVAFSSYLADTETGTWNPYIGGVEFWGAAYDNDNGILYFSQGSTFSKVEGGVVTDIGTFNYLGTPSSIVGMAWHDGTLYGVKNISTEAVYSIDVTTGDMTLIVEYDSTADLGGLAANPDTGALYATNDNTAQRGLVEVDLTTGDLTVIAPYPAGETDLDGLAYHDGRAYLIEDDSSADGLVYVYDFAAGDYVDQFATPWDANEVFSAGAWVGDSATPTASILLVDDDDNSPDVRPSYQAALTLLGVTWDEWDTNNSDDEPTAAELAAYETVIWFTGDEFGGFAGPGEDGEAALAEWLDGGQNRRLLLSSQDYHYDRTLTPFMTDYLGLASATNDNGDYTSIDGVADPFTGLSYTLDYPFSDFSDALTPGTGQVGFVGDNQNNAALVLEGADWCTSYSAFPWEAISTDADRAEALDAFLSWTCDAPTVTPTPTNTPVPGVCTWGDWQSVTPVNTARSRTGLAYVPSTGNFYMAGGEGSGGDRAIPIEEYDPDTDTWTDRVQLQTGVSNTGAAAVGDYVYVPGGFDGVAATDHMQRFDPVANSVTLMSPMPAVNWGNAVTAMGDKIYVLGGSTTGALGTTNYIYDVATDTWTTGAPMLTAVQFPTAATDGQYVYVMGGNTTNLATVQVYDPATDSWSAGTPLNEGRGAPASFYDGENVWVVGGGWTTFSATTEYWDGSSWQFGPELNAGSRTLGAAFGDGIALKAAGWNGNYVDEAEILAIDCAGGPTPTATNTPIPATSTPTGGATSIQLGSLESQSGDTPWLLLSLVGIAGLAGAAWVGARRSR